MSLVKEFKEFAVKGNMIDMAVGIIIGAAFGKIVTSLVNNIVMPPLGLLIGGMNFSELAVVLREEGANGEPVILAYGAFFQSVFDFLIVAVAIFAVVKIINQMKRKKETEVVPAAAPEVSLTDKLLIEIRDSLQTK